MSTKAAERAVPTAAFSTAKPFPDGPTPGGGDAESPPATISATLSPFLSPINWITSDAFQAGSTVGAADCENAPVPAPIEIANVNDNPSFRMCQSFQVVSR